MGEATYDENAFKITLSEYNNQKGNNFIMLDFESNPMKYEGGSYVKNTDVKYNSSLSVNFSNINSSLTMGVSRADSISVSYDASKTDYDVTYENIFFAKINKVCDNRTGRTSRCDHIV